MDIMDYLHWRSDLTFDERPYNELDAVAFCALGYEILDEVFKEKKMMTLDEVAEQFFMMNDETALKKRLSVSARSYEILKAFLTTLLAIVTLVSFMFLALICLFPQTMMELTYDMGMETSSIYFAEDAYRRTDDVGYIAYATEVAILDDNNDKIIKCGEKLIKDEGFKDFCRKRDEEVQVSTSYEQYVYGQICVAMYENGKKDEAIDRAFALIGEAFPRNNAVLALIVATNRAQDMQSLEKIKGKMNELQEKVLDDAAKAEIGNVLTQLEK